MPLPVADGDGGGLRRNGFVRRWSQPHCQEAVGDGHVYLSLTELEDRVTQLTGIVGPDVDNMKIQLLLDGQVVEKEVAGRSVLYLTPFYQAEAHTALKMAELAAEEDPEPEPLDSILEEEEKAWHQTGGSAEYGDSGSDAAWCFDYYGRTGNRKNDDHQYPVGYSGAAGGGIPSGGAYRKSG